MEKFRIIATPPGQAPEWVRKEWVGLELPMSGMPIVPELQTGALGGRPENVGGFSVDGQVAINLLDKKSPQAAEWWRINAPYVLSARLVFNQEVCETI